MLYSWIISLPMMVCLFWAIFFAVRLHRGSDEPRITGAILLFYIASTILYSDHWLYFSECPSFVGEWSYAVVNLCVYPFYYAYLLTLTRTKFSIEGLLLFFPAAIMAVIFPFCVQWGKLDHLHLAARLCFATQVVWVLIRGYHLISNTQKRMDNTYSDDRSRLLRPAHILLILFSITAVVSITLNIFGREFFTDNLLIGIPAPIMSVLLYGLGYVAAHTHLPQETVVQVETAEETERASMATTAETDELFMKITTALREQKLFSDPRLTIQDLAVSVGSNRTYVSQCINRRSGLSFSQFITRYRVEYAQQILCDSSYTTDHEAFEAAMALSGFTSNQTFYRVFKEVTGKTPIQFRKDKK